MSLNTVTSLIQGAALPAWSRPFNFQSILSHPAGLYVTTPQGIGLRDVAQNVDTACLVIITLDRSRSQVMTINRTSAAFYDRYLHRTHFETNAEEIVSMVYLVIEGYRLSRMPTLTFDELSDVSASHVQIFRNLHLS